MNLAPMRYKNFIWPHNPESFHISFARRMAVHPVPFGYEHLQGLSMAHRVMSGQGAFFGRDAYDKFKELATVFYDNTPGRLIHPVWMTTSAWFTALSLTQEPQAAYVSYSFTFREDNGLYKAAAPAAPKATPATAGAKAAATAAVYCVVRQGDTLWGLARAHHVSLASVIALNPQIKNPNLIHAGDRVRVK